MKELIKSYIAAIDEALKKEYMTLPERLQLKWRRKELERRLEKVC